MKKIFEPVTVGKIEMQSRILRSATLTDKGSENGAYLPYEKESCVELSKNKVGCIITGMIGVGTNAGAADFAPMANNESFPERFTEICRATHENGGRIVAQLTHAGIQALVFDEGENPWGPSPAVSMVGFEAVEMTKEQIKTVVSDFGKAALACKEAGADGVQLHFAHAYLISQFLSKYYNKRTDEYGGGIENRARFAFEVYDEVREKVGNEYPIWIKINYSDLIGDEGNGAEECLWVCKQMDARGVDAIEVSSGLAVDKASRPMQKAVEGAMVGHFTEGALKVAEAVSCDVISVGGYRTQAQIENCLNLGGIKAISMSRPFADFSYIADWTD